MSGPPNNCTNCDAPVTILGNREVNPDGSYGQTHSEYDCIARLRSSKEAAERERDALKHTRGGASQRARSL